MSWLKSLLFGSTEVEEYTPKEEGHHSDCSGQGPADTWIIRPGHEQIHFDNATAVKSLLEKTKGFRKGFNGDPFTLKIGNQFYGSEDESLDYIDFSKYTKKELKYLLPEPAPDIKTFGFNRPEKSVDTILEDFRERLGLDQKPSYVRVSIDDSLLNFGRTEPLASVSDILEKSRRKFDINTTIGFYGLNNTEMQPPKKDIPIIKVNNTPADISSSTPILYNYVQWMEKKEETKNIEIKTYGYEKLMQELNTKLLLNPTNLNENTLNIWGTKKKETKDTVPKFDYDMWKKEAGINIPDMTKMGEYVTKIFLNTPKIEDIPIPQVDITPVYLANQDHWLGGRNNISTMNSWIAEVNTHHSPSLQPSSPNVDTYIASYTQGVRGYNDVLKLVESRRIESESNNPGWTDFENNIYKKDMREIGRLSNAPVSNVAIPVYRSCWG